MGSLSTFYYFCFFFSLPELSSSSISRLAASMACFCANCSTHDSANLWCRVGREGDGRGRQGRGCVCVWGGVSTRHPVGREKRRNSTFGMRRGWGLGVSTRPPVGRETRRNST